MGIVQFFEQNSHGFCEKIEGKISYTKPILGQFCWAPILHLKEIPQTLEAEREVSREHENIKFKVRNINNNDFQGKNKLPVKLLDLRQNQELLIHSASKRPCIVLHYGATIFEDISSQLPSMGKKHLQQEKIMTVLPLFGIQDDVAHLGGFPPVMVARIRAMMYDQFFYFPKANSPLVYDSIGRLDHMQMIINNYNVCKFEPYKLTDECLAIIYSMVRRWFNLEIDEDFEAIVDLCRDACPEEYIPC